MYLAQRQLQILLVVLPDQIYLSKRQLQIPLVMLPGQICLAKRQLQILLVMLPDQIYLAQHQLQISLVMLPDQIYLGQRQLQISLVMLPNQIYLAQNCEATQASVKWRRRAFCCLAPLLRTHSRNIVTASEKQQFTEIQDGIYALGKIHKRVLNPSLPDILQRYL